MDISANNPAANSIGPGIDERQILSAVEASGYPLQTNAAEVLRPYFERVQQEWCYLDKDSGELRSIDIWAQQALHEWDPQPRVRPTLNLLIECKQSQLPYIFFPSISPAHSVHFPVIAGLQTGTVTITSDDDASTWTFPIDSVLGLGAEPFQRGPSYCSTFSKCVRKGQNLELSGVDAYSNLVLPLIKALQHFEVAEQPPKTAWYFDAHLVLALGVVDAAMIAATRNNEETLLTLLPWVRVVRHEYSEQAPRWDRDRLWAIDVVHKSFLNQFLTNHLLPFAKEFSERALRHQTELATGEGFIAGMGASSFDGLEGRLRPRSIESRSKRTAIIANSFLKFLFRRPEKD